LLGLKKEDLQKSNGLNVLQYRTFDASPTIYAPTDFDVRVNSEFH